jgi:WD40 repeat protein
VWRLSDAAAPLSVGLAHSNEVCQAHFSPDGKQIVSVGKDACVCVWNWFG